MNSTQTLKLHNPSSFTSLLLALSLFILAFNPNAATAQSDLQSPDEFLGYELGTAFTPHHRVVDYFEYVAYQKSNVELTPYGKSYEGRPLMVAILSSQDNMNRLEKIRLNNLSLTKPDQPEKPDELEMPSVVWLSYNVHGNESVSTEASMAVLWKLASGQADTVDEWLKNTIIILDPCINPDGRDRYASWYRRTVGMEIDLQGFTAEHKEPWPGGRTNHYMFDLNRDWAWGTQTESRQRIKLYRQWMPQIHVDFHEQGINSPYFFAPAAEPMHDAITPWQREFQKTIGKNNAKYFDEQGWLYFTRQVFDLYYPSYGDTWPTFNGAIGMTYEQGGSGAAGLAVLTATGDTLSLKDRIDHHRTTSFSTIEAASVNAPALIQNFRSYFSGDDSYGKYKSYLLKTSKTPGKAKLIKNLLNAQGISHENAASGSYSGHSFGLRGNADFTASEGDILISADQSSSRLLQVLFEPNSNLSDSLTYDITSWAIPFAYGLEAFASTDEIKSAPAKAIDFSTEVVDDAYAYLVPWTDRGSAQFLAAMIKAKVKSRRATKEFTIDGKSYEPGTLIVLKADNKSLSSDLAKIIRRISNETEIPIGSTSSGLVESGSDFGSGDVKYIKAPRVGMLFGSPMSSGSVGEIWHFFDEQISYPLHRIPATSLNKDILAKLDVLILPSGTYSQILSESKSKDLFDWVKAGGKVVALERAVSALAAKKETSLKSKPEAKPDSSKTEVKVYADRSRDATKTSVKGGVFEVKIDNTHPLFYGYGDKYYTLKRSSSAYELLPKGWNAGVLKNAKPVSGFTGLKAQKKIEGSLVFGVETMGKGSITYMVDNPLFRAFWEGGKLMFANAVFAY